MPRFVAKTNIVYAIRFDGSPDSAVQCARAIGRPITLTFDDDKPVLVNAPNVIEPGHWVVAQGPAVWTLTDEQFTAEYEDIDRASPLTPYGEELHRLGLATPGPKPDHGTITEDDTIRDSGSKEPEDELTVIEVTDRGYVCDGPWGEVTVPKDRAVFVRRAWAPDGA